MGLTGHSLNRGLAEWLLADPRQAGLAWRGLRRNLIATLSGSGAGHGFQASQRPGTRGRDYQADGSSDWIAVASGSSPIIGIAGPLTVACWFQTTTTGPGTQTIVGRSTGSTDRGGGLQLTGTNKLQGVLTAGGTGYAPQGSTTVATGIWYHGALTYDGAFIRLYLNGVQDVSPTAASGAVPITASCRIGQSVAGGSWFSGRLDDFRWWTRALSDPEVRAVYRDSRAGYPATLAAGGRRKQSAARTLAGSPRRPVLAWTPDPPFLFEE